MGSDDAFDILLLILVIAILTPIMISNTIPMLKGDVGGFNTLIEKTAQKTTGEIEPSDRHFKREDVLLMAIIADRRTPQPGVFQAAVDLNGDGTVEPAEMSPDITLDDLLNQRVAMLQTLNTYTAYTGDLELKTVVGNTGIKKWVISRK